MSSCSLACSINLNTLARGRPGGSWYTRLLWCSSYTVQTNGARLVQSRIITYFQCCTREVVAEKLSSLDMKGRSCSYFEPIALPIFGLELLRRAQAAQVAIDHDAHSRAEGLTLCHTVGSEDHCLTSPHHALDNMPQELSSTRVYS